MSLFITAICILAATAVLCALLAVRPLSENAARAANAVGVVGAVVGCLVGLCSVASGPWTGSESLRLPLGLPVGACSLGLDALSRLFLLPVFGLGLVCAASGGIALRHEAPDRHNFAAHWFFYHMLLLGMALVMTARDAVLFMLSREIMSLAPFFLIDFNDGDSKVRDASWVYLVAAHLGAVALMAFFTLLWQTTGGTSLETLRQTVSYGPLAQPGTVTGTALFVLAVLGFGAKAGLAPMLLPTGLGTLFCGLILIVGRIKAITQVIGYLVAENGIFLLGVPLMTAGTVWFELALLLDVFVAVFVMGIAINHISDSFASIDVARFRSLRD